MNPRQPKPINDIHSYIESVPYGEISLKISRINRKTVVIESVSEETLKYVSNDEALKDLDSLIKSLIDSRYTGEANVKLEMTDGSIRLIGIFNKKTTK